MDSARIKLGDRFVTLVEAATAAPDLLEALEKLINFYADYRTVQDGYEIRSPDEQTNEHIAAAMRIYAKARGEQP